jgi:hypothetical protein
MKRLGLLSALYAPAATPRKVLDTLHKAVVQALNPEPVQAAFKEQMIKPFPTRRSKRRKRGTRRKPRIGERSPTR